MEQIIRKVRLKFFTLVSPRPRARRWYGWREGWFRLSRPAPAYSIRVKRSKVFLDLSVSLGFALREGWIIFDAGDRQIGHAQQMGGSSTALFRSTH